MAKNQENERQRIKAELEKNVAQLESTIQKQEDRINYVQSSGFQILNFYFVFQGVIFTAIANGSSSLSPSNRWMPFTLSLLASMINFVSLVVIGGKYNRILAERDRSSSDLHKQDSQLSLYNDPSSSSNREVVLHAVDKLEQVETILDQFANHVRKFCFWLCIGACLSVAVIMVVACWTISRDETTSKGSSNVNRECFRLCDAKCMNI